MHIFAEFNFEGEIDREAEYYNYETQIIIKAWDFWSLIKIQKYKKINIYTLVEFMYIIHNRIHPSYTYTVTSLADGNISNI